MVQRAVEVGVRLSLALEAVQGRLGLRSQPTKRLVVEQVQHVALDVDGVEVVAALLVDASLAGLRVEAPVATASR